jgi:hypothetical protein
MAHESVPIKNRFSARRRHLQLFCADIAISYSSYSPIRHFAQNRHWLKNALPDTKKPALRLVF